jgi:hypothetical protein
MVTTRRIGNDSTHQVRLADFNDVVAVLRKSYESSEDRTVPQSASLKLVGQDLCKTPTTSALLRQYAKALTILHKSYRSMIGLTQNASN